jgi:serine/threonine protein kinase
MVGSKVHIVQVANNKSLWQLCDPKACEISFGKDACWNMSTILLFATCVTASRTSSTCTHTGPTRPSESPAYHTRRYLVVDLMSGGDLRFHISRKTFTEEAVRFWISELGCALRYIHGQGIIHRDVKPDNVLLDADGHVHLTDFVRPSRRQYTRQAADRTCRTLPRTLSPARP